MLAPEYASMFALEDRLWWYRGMRAITIALLRPHLDPGRSLAVLDVGCGTGYSMRWLQQTFDARPVFGIDASPHAAQFWKTRGVSRAALASAADLPFDGERFDLVTCFDVVCQFPETQTMRVLQEMQRVLKPGGLAFLREPAYAWLKGPHDEAVGARRRFTLAELRGQAASAGLICRRSTYANTLLFGPAVCRRLASRLFGGTTSDVRPVPGIVNEVFGAALGIESRLIAHASFPFGLSTMLVLQKLEP